MPNCIVATLFLDFQMQNVTRKLVAWRSQTVFAFKGQTSLSGL